MRIIKKEWSSGFTLIELVIVFSVLAILSVISVASFVSYSRSQAINNDAKSIITIINQAKSNASSQVKPSVCSGKVLNGYSVSFILSNPKNVYKLNVVCSNTESVLSTYRLSSAITFDTTAVTGTTMDKVFFNILNGGIKLTNSNNTLSSGQIKLRGFNNTQCRVINLANDGVITAQSC